MSNKKQNNKPVEQIDEELKKLKKRKMDLIKEVDYKSKQEYRKARARLLIETGALAQKYFELEDLTIEEREEIFKMFSPFITANKPKKYKKK